MKVDLIQIYTIFDEIIEGVTNEELGVYWLRTTRPDSLVITLAFSTYEDTADVHVYIKEGTAIADISMEKCSEIRILDTEKKQLEIIHNHEGNRCFIDLHGDCILRYSE
jgi:hypothetical protein